MRVPLLAIALCACHGASPEPAALPVVTITLVLPGADGELVEQQAVEPVEEAVNRIPGVRSLGSRIEDDHATVSIEVAPADVERVSHDVRHALAEIQAQLPRELLPPTITHARPHDDVTWLAVQGTLPIATMSEAVRDSVVPRLERVAGVGRVELRGIAEGAVIVRPDLDRLAASGVTMFDVLAAVRTSSLDGKLDDLGDLVVQQRGDTPIRLRDIALIELGYQREPGSEPRIVVHAQYAARIADVLRAVRAEVATLPLPPGLQLVEMPPRTEPRAPLAITLRGPALDELRRRADALVADLAAAHVTHVVRDPPAGQPEHAVLPDRARAAQLDVPIEDVYATIRALGGTDAGELVIDGRRRDVRVRIDGASLDAAIERLRVRSRQGALVPISTVVTTTVGTSEGIVRRDRERAITLSIDAPPPLLDTARARARALALPPGYRVVVTP